ncbi:MAG: PQQ-dependent sugar dehydrogenase, partial [Ginsengibacter sp.]
DVKSQFNFLEYCNLLLSFLFHLSKLSMKYFRLLYLLIVCAACNSLSQKSQRQNDSTTSDSTSVKLELVTSAINMPVQLGTSPDNSHRLFLADLGGKIWILKNGSLQPKPCLDISGKLEQRDSASDVRAMFGFAFHPQFATNKKIYVSYNAPTPASDSNNCRLVIAEFTVSASNADSVALSSEREIMEFEGHGIDHDACEIAFGPDGYLYISMGDNNTPLIERKGQDLNSLLGKLLRIDVDKIPYSIPADNPFVGVKNARPEIWAYGLRRFWRFSFDPQSHILIGGEIGDKKEEEIDIITKGANYGWPIIEGDSLIVQNSGADPKSFTAPINTYTRETGICVIGGSFYYGDSIPSLRGKYVFADYVQKLFTLTKNEQGTWERQTVNVQNMPTDPFLIYSCNTDEYNELYLTGVINTASGFKGVVYKIIKG